MTESLTSVLEAWNAGDQRGLDLAFPLVYDELRKRARNAFRNEPGDHTLRPTEVVNEVYLRFRKQLHGPRSKNEFLAVAALLMHRILVDHARRRTARRRDARVAIDDDLPGAPPALELTALAEALAALEEQDPRAHSVVVLRYLAGLSEEEVADALQVSPRTVRRSWRLGRAFLNRLLAPAETP